MKALIFCLLLSTTAFGQNKNADVPDLSKGQTTGWAGKPTRADSIWTSANRYDTVPVKVEMSNGKIENMLAVYEWGHYAATRDMPRFHSYLTTNRRRLSAVSRKPKRIAWEKMRKDGR